MTLQEAIIKLDTGLQVMTTHDGVEQIWITPHVFSVLLAKYEGACAGQDTYYATFKSNGSKRGYQVAITREQALAHLARNFTETTTLAEPGFEYLHQHKETNQ